MQESFYREEEIARLPAFLPAATYDLAHTLPARACLDERVPFEVVLYLPQAETTMKSLPAEFHAARQLLAGRQKPATPASVTSLPPRHDKDT